MDWSATIAVAGSLLGALLGWGLAQISDRQRWKREDRLRWSNDRRAAYERWLVISDRYEGRATMRAAGRSGSAQRNVPWEAVEAAKLDTFGRLPFDELTAAHWAVETLGSQESVSIVRAWFLAILKADEMAEDPRGIDGELRDRWVDVQRVIESLRAAFLVQVRREMLGSGGAVPSTRRPARGGND